MSDWAISLGWTLKWIYINILKRVEITVFVHLSRVSVYGLGQKYWLQDTYKLFCQWPTSRIRILKSRQIKALSKILQQYWWGSSSILFKTITQLQQYICMYSKQCLVSAWNQITADYSYKLLISLCLKFNYSQQRYTAYRDNHFYQILYYIWRQQLLQDCTLI